LVRSGSPLGDHIADAPGERGDQHQREDDQCCVSALYQTFQGENRDAGGGDARADGRVARARASWR
jgi:hypothetical protein